MRAISELINRIAFNWVANGKTFSKIDVWNQNWVLLQEIKKLLHILRWRPPKFKFFLIIKIYSNP